MINDKPSNIGSKSTSEDLIRQASGTSAVVKPKEGAQNSDSQISSLERSASSDRAEENKVKEASKQAASATSALENREALKEKVNQVIPKVRELLQKNQRSLDFKVAEKENRVIITVIDKETDKVIRQIPPEDFLQMAESIEQGINGLAPGVMLDSKV